MSLSASLLPEFDQEMANTRKTLARVPDGSFSWKPHEKSYSFLEISNHLANLPEWGAATIQTESLDIDPEAGGYTQPPPAESTEALLRRFDENVASFRSTLEAASDEDLMKSWTLLNSGQAMFSMPRIAVIRGMILNHMIHHRAQMTVYLRLNDIPVPGLYGPSADEAVG